MQDKEHDEEEDKELKTKTKTKTRRTIASAYNSQLRDCSGMVKRC